MQVIPKNCQLGANSRIHNHSNNVITATNNDICSNSRPDKAHVTKQSS